MIIDTSKTMREILALNNISVEDYKNALMQIKQLNIEDIKNKQLNIKDIKSNLMIQSGGNRALEDIFTLIGAVIWLAFPVYVASFVNIPMREPLLYVALDRVLELDNSIDNPQIVEGTDYIATGVSMIFVYLIAMLSTNALLDHIHAQLFGRNPPTQPGNPVQRINPAQRIEEIDPDIGYAEPDIGYAAPALGGRKTMKKSKRSKKHKTRFISYR
jgi:hypothetical protein